MNGPQRPSILMPALVGGAAAGLLSGIPILNCLCCLWAIGGGILAAYLWAKDSPAPMTAGDGALVGAFAGVAAAVADTLISIPLAAVNAAFLRRIMERLAQYAQDMPSGWEQMFDRSGPFSLPWFFLGLVITAFLFAVLGALGGAIGMAIFGKKSGSAGAPRVSPPPQPPAAPQGPVV